MAFPRPHRDAVGEPSTRQKMLEFITTLTLCYRFVVSFRLGKTFKTESNHKNFVTMLNIKAEFCSRWLQAAGREICSSSGFSRASHAGRHPGTGHQGRRTELQQSICLGARKFLAPDHARGLMLKKTRKKHERWKYCRKSLQRPF